MEEVKCVKEDIIKWDSAVEEEKRQLESEASDLEAQRASLRARNTVVDEDNAKLQVRFAECAKKRDAAAAEEATVVDSLRKVVELHRDVVAKREGVATRSVRLDEDHNRLAESVQGSVDPAAAVALKRALVKFQVSAFCVSNSFTNNRRISLRASHWKLLKNIQGEYGDTVLE